MVDIPVPPRTARSLGPALIVASVVLGPGSILTASRVGADFGHRLGWVVAVACGLMVALTALAARLGATLEGTPCEEVRRRAGRVPAALVGIVLFLVVACFQFSNNVGVVAAIEPLVGGSGAWRTVLLVGLNAGIAAALFGLRGLYRPVELGMKLLVGLMALGFLGNLFLVRPSPLAVAGGLVPRLPFPEGASLLPVLGLVGTTFSVAGAFYAAYLVREKGWGRDDLGRVQTDSIIGIGVLGLLSLAIMATAGEVLHGRVSGKELTDVGEVARQLEPLFGSGARTLFCLGLLGGAFSSFLVNAMIGGTVLSDGLGLGSKMDGVWPRRLTVLALVVGMGVALLVLRSGEKPVNLIIFAQALTVLGNPVLAGVLLWLACRPGAGHERTPRRLVIGALLSLTVALALATRTAIALWF